MWMKHRGILCSCLLGRDRYSCFTGKDTDELNRETFPQEGRRGLLFHLSQRISLGSATFWSLSKKHRRVRYTVLVWPVHYTVLVSPAATPALQDVQGHIPGVLSHVSSCPSEQKPQEESCRYSDWPSQHGSR